MKHTRELVSKTCAAYEGGTPPLDTRAVAKIRKEIHDGWKIEGGKKLSRGFKFKNFKEAMVFINRIATLAEEEQHHPDIFVSYNRVNIELTTHEIGGLSENDFIVAAKIDDVEKTPAY